MELLELTAFTQPSALAACLQAATARLPCVLCSDSDEATTTASHSACVRLKTSSPVASSCLVGRSPSPPSSTSSPATANWQPERGRQAGYSSTPYAAAALRDQPRSPAPRGPDRGVTAQSWRDNSQNPWTAAAAGVGDDTPCPCPSIRSTRPPPRPPGTPVPSSAALSKGTSLLAPGCCTRPPQRGQRQNGRGRV